MPQRMISRNTIGVLIGVCILLLAGLGFYHLSTSKTVEPVSTTVDWVGDWNVSYFYENAPDLVFEGVMHIDMKNVKEARMQIWPPKSKEREILEIRDLVIGEKGLQGQIVHDLYKIRGGHLSENVELVLTGSSTLQGTGRCVAFCAEGTDGQKIIWSGEKSN